MTTPGWETIVHAVGAHAPLADSGGGPRAAVAIVLRDGAHGIELLLIRRAEAEADPWSGHVGLPGGRAEPEDAGLLATAVRETLEETGIDLAREARQLGRLDDLRALAGGRPVDLVIAPFVFRLLRPAEGAPSPEVVSLHWVPLSAVLDPKALGSFEYRYEAGAVQLPCLHVGGLLVWGLTFRMLSNLSAVLERARSAGESGGAS